MKSIFIFIILAIFVGAYSVQAAVKGKPKPASKGSVLKFQGQLTAPRGTPTWEIQEIERRMEAYETGDNLTSEQKDKNSKLKREILTGVFDLRELSRLALDQHWKTLSKDQQNHFVNLMIDLLETKAIFSKEQSKAKGNAYVVRYKGDQYLRSRSQARTRTQVYVPKNGITIDIHYMLKKAGEGWRVFDVIVDDASLIKNYKFQFNKIINEHSYNDLVRRMEDKLKEIKTKK